MKKTRQSKFVKSAVFLSLGAEVGGAVGTSAFLGYLLDVWIGTAPIFVITLVLLATVAVFWRILRIVRLMDENQENSDE